MTNYYVKIKNLHIYCVQIDTYFCNNWHILCHDKWYMWNVKVCNKIDTYFLQCISILNESNISRFVYSSVNALLSFAFKFSSIEVNSKSHWFGSSLYSKSATFNFDNTVSARMNSCLFTFMYFMHKQSIGMQ